MGMFDSLPKGSQVKLWNCEMIEFNVGDEVSSYFDKYVVLLREGGYVLVENGKITEIVEDEKFYYPEDFPDIHCLDKWGNLATTREKLIGIYDGIAGMSDPYYWSEDDK